MSRLFRHSLVLLAGALTLATTASAQRHIRHLNSLTGSYGSTEPGRLLGLSYGRFLTNTTRLDVLATRERGQGRAGIGEFSAYGVAVGGSRQLFRVGSSVYVHAQGLVLGRYERKQENNTGGREGGKAPQGAAVGPLLGLDTDVYLADAVSLALTAQKGYLWLNPQIDRWPGFYSAGLRFHFR
ncbi:hypothetical protein ACFPAF_16955 [Hymenobacter endophyticus]|uniref:Conjugal transfer protein TraO n=1 Tax=Hymenobacter endophyticus TaxID=3076335 RepID=A0ABU3TL48_9BACT|nr:hypothetical protein [Hymenobacter endophyticus]MDU0372094.1 hypothetical protein [Hymenobacter endophyticus]